MKLIDVDALSYPKVIGKRGGVKYEYYDISDAPVIDAIPVEWLEKRRQNLLLAAMVHSTVFGDNSVELCHAVNVILAMWQEEREEKSQ